MMRPRLLSVALSLLALGLTTQAGTAEAQPYQHAVRIEGAVSFMLSDPHKDLYGIGGGGGLGYEYRLHDYVGIEAHFGAYFFPGDDPLVELGTYYAPAVGARIHVLPSVDFLDLYVVGRAALVFTGGEARFGIEADLGVEFPIRTHYLLGPFVRYAHVFQPDGNNLGPPNGQYLAAGVTFGMRFGLPEPVPTDDDGDGLFDDDDQCPLEPEDMDGFEDRDGCPEPDNDGDGIDDVDDACPSVPEDMDGFEDENGCPESDNDGDNIGDTTDACPNEAEDFDGDRDTDGCPEDPEDGDDDGVSDADDQCQTEPEDRDGFEDNDGCPDPDNDQDGVPDVDDACPLAPGGDAEDGCPQTVRVTESSIQILQKIAFRTDSTRLMRRSERVLREVAAVLQANPQIQRVRIEGHTDARASEESNQRLSQARAEAVLTWLVEHGIDASRLEAAGFGESRPLIDEDTPEAHRANRRVEFVIGPTR